MKGFCCGSRGLIEILLVLAFLSFSGTVLAAEMSGNTEACIDCHSVVTPGIVADWQASRHFKVSPAEGLQKDRIERRISVEKVSAELAGTAVGCAECHMMNADKHPDSFEHNGFTIHTVVSPSDCATCHPTEVTEFADNLMGEAYASLMNNPTYKHMIDSTNGVHEFDEGLLKLHGSDPMTEADS
ncbi:MAG: multiheme c-type cytochrome, partial [Desulfuromusa sp.]|nr:multiheme c-type cytochrome [Desulfuromusa sp.]